MAPKNWVPKNYKFQSRREAYLAGWDCGFANGEMAREMVGAEEGSRIFLYFEHYADGWVDGQRVWLERNRQSDEGQRLRVEMRARGERNRALLKCLRAFSSDPILKDSDVIRQQQDLLRIRRARREQNQLRSKDEQEALYRWARRHYSYA